MANEEQLKILDQGVTVWNEWRLENPNVFVDLRDADLRDRKLSGVNFDWADLRFSHLDNVDLSCAGLTRADVSVATMTPKTVLSGAFLNRAHISPGNLSGVALDGADLTEANLSSAVLVCADLRGAKLIEACLSLSNLQEADLREANLMFAKLDRASLLDTDFTRAQMGGTVFGVSDLSVAKGLKTVYHIGPSTIGIDTIYASEGKIPREFLFGAGVPAALIEQIPSLVEASPEFSSCFISYSTRDEVFSNRLLCDLRENGVRAWYFPDSAKGGELKWGEIGRGIAKYDKTVVICSKNALESPAVLGEIVRALNREDKEGRNILLPISIDDYIFCEWDHARADDVLEKVVEDFRGWEGSDDRYHDAFTKLLNALKQENSET